MSSSYNILYMYVVNMNYCILKLIFSVLETIQEWAVLKTFRCKDSEAAQDSSSGLTYSALMGVKKQSVGHVEHLLSSEVAKFMEKIYT